MTQLDGTRVLVTGGTSGLGRAMAQALADAGARVALTSRDSGRAHMVAAEISKDATAVELDVRDERRWRGLRRRDRGALLGGLDMLVNNAGIGMRTVNPRFLTEPQPFWWASHRPAFATCWTPRRPAAFLVARAVTGR